MDTSAASTPALAREAFLDLRKLVQRELSLTRDEVRRDLVAMRIPLVAIAIGAGLGRAGARLCLDASAALGPRRARAAGVALSALGLLLIALGWRALPKRPFRETRARLNADARVVAEEIVR